MKDDTNQQTSEERRPSKAQSNGGTKPKLTRHIRRENKTRREVMAELDEKAKLEQAARQMERYNILDFITKNDIKAAMRVLKKAVKDNNDAVSARYLVDQACGSAVQREKARTDDKPNMLVTIMLPPRFSDVVHDAGRKAVGKGEVVTTTVQVGTGEGGRSDDTEPAGEAGRSGGRRRLPARGSRGGGG